MLIDVTPTINEGNSFIVSIKEAFEAGIVTGIMMEHHHGGGFGPEYASYNDEKEVWEVHEKHEDGGKSLAIALYCLKHVMNAKITDDARNEMTKRTR